MKKIEKEINGKKLILETDKIAKQANGAVIVTYGDTVVLCTVCASQKNNLKADFFPLTCSYQVKFYSAGKIPGGYIKRETRPSDSESLIGRLIDRPIRPLFPNNYMSETIISCTVLSYDKECCPKFAALLGASAALCISDIPFLKPIAGATIGKIEDDFIFNPSPEELEKSSMNLFMATSLDGLVMVESEAKEVQEDDILDAFKFGHEIMIPVIEMQNELRELAGKEKRAIEEIPPMDQALEKEILSFAESKLKDALGKTEKMERYNDLRQVKVDTVANFAENESIGDDDIATVIDSKKKEIIRKNILHRGNRVDGRKTKDIRDITGETGLLPRTHGSALFTRGETQALVVATLGAKDDRQSIEEIDGSYSKSFYVHYNFPGYSVGEAKRPGPPGRREIGHGRLAERSIVNMLPNNKEFPYTIRLVSEITESNGSSSMASVCGGTLALLDAGVPLAKQVAGIAMGLVSDGKKNVVISDILGDEDHIGDMDFKVAGTKDGITALQMDIKVEGLTWDVLKRALGDAKTGRLHILKKMSEILEAPREDVSVYAPRFVQYKIPVSKIKIIIGPGGQTIRSISSSSNTKVDVSDTGMINISAVNKEDAEKALTMIRELVKDVEVGNTYEGAIKKITDFGMFVECLPGIEGLVHISEVRDEKIDNLSDFFTEGQIVKVKASGYDHRGKLKLTMKNI